MKKKIMTLLGISIILAGCGTQPSSPAQNNDSLSENPTVITYTIGAIAPLSGPAANYGEDAVNAYQFAVREYNQANTTTQLQLIVEDAKCSGKDAISAAQKLINVDQVDIIVGGNCSSETIPAGKLAVDNQVVLISPTASSPEVSKIGDYVFRFYNDVDQTNTIIDYLAKNNLSNVGIVYQNSDYATALAATLMENFDGEVVLEEKFNGDEKDMSIIAKKVAGVLNDIDMMIFIPQDDNTFASLLKALEKENILADLQGKMIGTEATYSDKLMEEHADLMEGHLVTQFPPFATFGEDAVAFVNEFKQEHEVKFTDALLSLDREAIALAIDAVTNNAENPVAYLQQITQENPRNGFFGQYYFDAEGDAVGLQFFVNQVVDGELTLVE